jgi:hypothetical protein
MIQFVALTALSVLTLVGNASSKQVLTTSYNESLSFQNVFYAASSYCLAYLKLQQWTCNACRVNPGFQLRVLLQGVNDTYGMVGHNPLDEQIVVAFKGTNPKNLANWITDLSTGLVPYTHIASAPANALVHDGFYGSYNSMRAAMIANVNALLALHPTYSILFTGHSMGGASAVLAALDITDLLAAAGAQNDVVLYTYGQPRLGNPTFAAFASTLLAQRTLGTWRSVHWRDPVPHLPPQIAFNFEQVGTEVWYTGDMSTYQVCAAYSEDPSCADSVAAWDVTNHIYYFGIHVGTDCDQAVAADDIAEENAALQQLQQKLDRATNERRSV